MVKQNLLDLAPGPGNTRNSEGGFLDLRDGRILFVYSRYGAGHDDDDAADLWSIVSSDGGGTWSAPRLCFPRSRVGADNVMSVTLRRMDNGDVGLFYLEKRPGDSCRMFLTRSADEGETFTDPVCCIPHRGRFTVNNDRVIRLRSGRWLIPSAPIEILVDERTGVREFGWSHAVYYGSDDDGATWRRLGSVRPCGGFERSRIGLQEPGVLELADGTVWSWMRTDVGRQYEAFSRDGGETWTPAQPSQFTAPWSPLSAKRLADGSILAVWNPVPILNGTDEVPDGFWTGGRTPLVCARSLDDGRSFSEPEVLENAPDHGYAYTAIHPLEDGSALLAYCAGGPEDGISMLNRLRIAKVEF